MKTLNFIVVAETLLRDRLDAIQSGFIKFNVANQFDASVIASALGNLTEENVEQLLDNSTNMPNMLTPTSIMAVAHALSTFEVEDPSRAWFD